MRAYQRSWELLKEKKKLQLRVKNSRIKTVLRMIQKEKHGDPQGKFYKMLVHQEKVGEETVIFLSLQKLLELKDLEFIL